MKWRKMILLVVAVAAVGSIIIALLLPNYYQSSATFIPSNLSAYDRQILFNTESSDRMINYFGDRNDIDRILAFANSGPLLNHMVNHFQLYDHYDIDTTKRLWRDKAIKELTGNYKAFKHELGYVEISIMDTDRELAARMVNHVLIKIDQANTQIIQDRNRQILVMMQDQLKEKTEELNVLTDRMSEITNDTTRYKVLHNQQTKVLEDYNSLNSLVDQYRGTVENNFSSLFIIEAAQPADKKAKPIRWLIVVSATLIALFLALLAAVIIEQYNDIKHELSYA